MDKPSGFDDLAGLFFETELSPAVYQTFTDGGVKPAVIEKRQMDAAPVSAEPSPCHHSPAPAPVVEFVSAGALHNRANAPKTEPTLNNLALFSNWGSWSGLDMVFSAAERPAIQVSQPRYIREGVFAVGGICGGVGATSLAASLARLQARQGGRALLLDPFPSSVMPLFFGSCNTALEYSTFVLPGDSRRSAVHICRKSSTGHQVGDADYSVATWMRNVCNSNATESDAAFLDAGSVQRYDFLSEFGSGLVRILVVTPETRCLVKLADFERQQIETGQHSDPNSVLLLLNQFDDSDPLHVEIRSRLARRFRDRLIPVVIRRDREMAVALAEGSTVADWAPDSICATDLNELFAWLRERNPLQTHPELSRKVQCL